MNLISKNEVYKRGKIVLTEKILKVGAEELTRVSLSLGKNSALIIPVDSKNNFYLVRQKRDERNEYILEFPSGGIEGGEDDLEAAKRELSEELGLEGKMKYLGKFYPFYSLVDLEVSVFLAEDVKELTKDIATKPDFYEYLEKMILTQKELFNLIEKGQIQGAYTLSALSILHSHNIFFWGGNKLL